MNESRKTLIADLVGDLRPIAGPVRVARSLVAWLAVALLYNAAVLLATGTPHHGALEFLTVPAYGLELAVAAAAVALLCWAALRSAIPGRDTWSSLLAPAVALALWVLLLVLSMTAAAPSAFDEPRDHCFMQAVLFALPNGALLLLATRRWLPLEPRLTGALAGGAAAALSAALMQIACMHEPGHALAYHLSAIPALAGVGALLAPGVLASQSAVSRRPKSELH